MGSTASTLQNRSSYSKRYGPHSKYPRAPKHRRTSSKKNVSDKKGSGEVDLLALLAREFGTTEAAFVTEGPQLAQWLMSQVAGIAEDDAQLRSDIHAGIEEWRINLERKKTDLVELPYDQQLREHIRTGVNEWRQRMRSAPCGAHSAVVDMADDEDLPFGVEDLPPIPMDIVCVDVGGRITPPPMSVTLQYPIDIPGLPSNIKATILSFAFYHQTVTFICPLYKELAYRHKTLFKEDYHGVMVTDAGDMMANGWYQRLDSKSARPITEWFVNNVEQWQQYANEGRPLFFKDDGYFIRYTANGSTDGCTPAPIHGSFESFGSTDSHWSLVDPDGNCLYHVRSNRKMPPSHGWVLQDVCRTRRHEEYENMTVNITTRRHRGADYGNMENVKPMEIVIIPSDPPTPKEKPPTPRNKPRRLEFPDEITPWSGYFVNSDEFSELSGKSGSMATNSAFHASMKSAGKDPPTPKFEPIECKRSDRDSPNLTE